jgi:superfamily I DNA/RNA helicase
MAGPGTGKSFAMKRRIARLIEEEEVDPARILAVTFTRTAAADLKQELHAMGIEGCENIKAGTLHSFCFKLLMRDSVFNFLGRVPRGLVSFSSSGVARFEAEPMIADLSRNDGFGGAREISKRILAFEAAWARLQHEAPGWAQNNLDQNFETQLVEWLQFHEGMLVGELVPQALGYLRDNPTADALEGFDHVVVDEYQDLNRAEQELLDVLGSNCSLSIVGDVDQSIYSFRHAHPDGILDFSSRHNSTHDATLDECRRCGRKIVTVANSVITRNHPNGAGPRLLPLNPPDREGEIAVVQWNSLQEEVEGLAEHIEWLIEGGDYTPGDILVLSPRRLIANGIKDQLAARQIDAHSFYNDKLLEPEQAQLSFNLLQLLVNPEDRVALRFFLGHGSPSWRSGQYANLKSHCEETGKSPSEVLESLASGDSTLSGVGQLVNRWILLQEQLDDLRDLEVGELLDELFPTGEAWADGILELLFEKLDDVDTAAKLLRLIHTEITQPEMPPAGGFVRLMSLHKSKGLTSKVTIIVGCIKGLIPFVDPGATPAEAARLIQEQRRLFYVAITRAKERLVFSSVTTLERPLAHKLGAIVQGGSAEVGRTIACEFMRELGPEAPRAILGSRWVENDFS